ncbi:MAG TPA: hypothetical protein VI685_28025 [Candidatus Angelobacter sp.]
MKILGIAVLILLVAASAFWRLRSHHRRAGHAQNQKAATNGAPVYMSLRNQLLQGSRAQLGLPATSAPAEPWAALMEMGTPEGTATVVAVSDGTASIYLSSGGGYIGGGQQHQAIRNACENMLGFTRQYQPLMHPTRDFPLPQAGWIVFYAVTDAGVFTAGAPEQELASRHDWLGNLYAAGQDIVTQYRLTSPK